MPRPSTVKRLPPEIREMIGTLLDQGRTLDEILDKLRELGTEVSRSALGRYAQQVGKVGERMRRARAVAEALVGKLGQAPESKLTRLNVELMHNVIMDLVMSVAEGQDTEPGEDGEAPKVALDPMGAMLLAKSLDHLAKASKADADLIGKIREQAETAAKRQAADTAVKAAREGGLTAEAVEEIRSKILGIKK